MSSKFRKPPELLAFALLSLIVILVGCGQLPAAEPTVMPSVTPSASAGTAAAGTPAQTGLTLGDLAARVNAAWPTVRAYRITFTGPVLAQARGAATPLAGTDATPAATPLAQAQRALVSMREVVLPDLQRQEVTGLGAYDHEAVAAGGTLYLRGALVELIAPGTPQGTWVAIDAAAIPARSALSTLLGGLPQLPGSPLAAIPERLWPQTLRDLGITEFDGRDCHVYGAANTVTQTGMRVDYEIAIDDRDLPCFVDTIAGGASQGRDDYTAIDAELAIAPPAAATPVAVPATLATPSAHD